MASPPGYYAATTLNIRRCARWLVPLGVGIHPAVGMQAVQCGITGNNNTFAAQRRPIGVGLVWPLNVRQRNCVHKSVTEHTKQQQIQQPCDHNSHEIRLHCFPVLKLISTNKMPDTTYMHLFGFTASSNMSGCCVFVIDYVARGKIKYYRP